MTALIVGCASGDYYTDMCQRDEIRVEYADCERSFTSAQIVYISTGSSYEAPAIGGRINQSEIQKTIPPKAHVQKNAVPASGGQIKSISGIQRGGFGVGRGSSSGS